MFPRWGILTGLSLGVRCFDHLLREYIKAQVLILGGGQDGDPHKDQDKRPSPLHPQTTHLDLHCTHFMASSSSATRGSSASSHRLPISWCCSCGGGCRHAAPRKPISLPPRSQRSPYGSHFAIAGSAEKQTSLSRREVLWRCFRRCIIVKFTEKIIQKPI